MKRCYQKGEKNDKHSFQSFIFLKQDYATINMQLELPSTL